MLVSVEVFIGFFVDLLEHEQRDDETVNSEDTSHDNWDDGFEDEFRLEDSH